MIQNRFKDLPWFEEVERLNTEEIEIGIVGAGGIGSWTTFMLARLGSKIFVYDDDILEEHNIGGQLYGISHVGQPKVNALQTIVKDFCDNNLSVFNELYTEEKPTSNIMISAVDNMAARKIIFEKWVELYKATEDENMLFIDGRMLAENMQVYAVTPSRIEAYRETLFDDEEIQEQPCSAKATSHCGAMIATIITQLLTNWLTNQKVDIREVPFNVTYDIPLLEFTLN